MESARPEQLIRGINCVCETPSERTKQKTGIPYLYVYFIGNTSTPLHVLIDAMAQNVINENVGGGPIFHSQVYKTTLYSMPFGGKVT
jgi:hypothetical protein